MLFILLILLIFMLLISYYITRKDILSPWFISIAMFTITVAIAALNYRNWSEDISSITLISVVLALSFFGLGEVITQSTAVKIVFNNKYMDGQRFLDSNNYIKIQNKYIIISIVIMLLVIYFNFQQALQLAEQMGYSSGMSNLLYYVRQGQFNQNIDSSKSFLLNLGIAFSTIISYFYIFVFLFNYICSIESKKRYILLIPGIINLINIVLSTGRTQFINLVTFILIITFILLRKSKRNKRNLNLKIISYSILGLTIFIVIFRLTGFLTGKSDNLTLWNNISIYVGSPIIALSKYFENPPGRFLLGSETFYSIYHVFRKMGFAIPNYNLILDYVSWNNVNNINIYTSIRRYIHDFGLTGMVIIMFLMGAFYGSLYDYVKTKKRIGLSSVIYAMLMFPIVQIALEERFFTNVISIQGFYNIFFMFIIWKFFIKEKNLNNVI